MGKCWNIRIAGKVQNIGFRSLIEDNIARLYELSDISRKLDIGIDVLLNIKEDTKTLPDIKNGIDTLNTKFDSFISEQKEHNLWMKEHSTWMKGHNQRLEKILEKLAEK